MKNPVDSQRYVARICWNTARWVEPTFEAAQIEKGTYAAKNGFGHEEWLFNFAWMIGEYHYAYLTPVRESGPKVGQKLNLDLYAIGEHGFRGYVAAIEDCEVLSAKQAKFAYQEYKRRGWFKRMKRDVAAIGGNSEFLSNANPTSAFNVRFKQGSATILDVPFRPPKSDIIHRLQRYVLTRSSRTEPPLRLGRRRGGSTTPPRKLTVAYRGHSGGKYDKIHNDLQAELLTQLEEQFGKGNVICEKDNVDLTIQTKRRHIIIEVKSDPVARIAIRQALGQILEYALFNRKASGRLPELFIIAPGDPTVEIAQYLQRLRTEYNLHVDYLQFSSGQQLPPI